MADKKYRLEMTTVFRRQFKAMKKRGLKTELLNEIVNKLQCGEPLLPKNRDHALTGNWIGHRECHITPDWLLVYRIVEDELILSLVRTGTHSDLDF